MKYSVVMPCLLRESKHKQVVIDCIESVRAYSNDYEFIIIDDGSPLMTGFLFDEADTYIRHKVNKGASVSENDGLLVARGEYIVVINDDVIVCDGWLDGLEKPFHEREGVGVTAPAILHQRLINQGRKGIHDDHRWFPGNCFMFPRSTFEKVGKFDERFIPYNGEDTDFFQRVLDAGLKLTRNFDIVIQHKEGDVLHTFGNYEKRAQEANQQFLEKHGIDPVQKFYPPM
jgi:GT2 family glycosyltransferase